MLTDIHCRKAQPRDKPYKLTDGAGLFLLVSPGGTRKPEGLKHWRFAYRFDGKQKLLSFGVYPDVTLVEARRRRQVAREQLAAGNDPSAVRKQERRTSALKAKNTFEAVAREWWEAKSGGWSRRHSDAMIARLEKQLFPALGDRPVAEIDAPELLDAIRAIERRGALEEASKSLAAAGQVFRYAIATARASRDPSRDLRGALRTREVRHYNALKETELPEFLDRLDAYDGNSLTRHAMRLLMLTFVRTGELRGAKWNEFNLEKAEWRIPGERMKMGAEHIVPLSRQAIAVIEEIMPLSGNREHLFPNEHNPLKFMSENTILYALYRMGYRGRATGHGFRATASTILNEQGWRADAIERQLAHTEQNKIRAAYHRSEHLPERRRMMQAWADHLDSLRSSVKVVPLHRAARGG